MIISSMLMMKLMIISSMVMITYLIFVTDTTDGVCVKKNCLV